MHKPLTNYAFIDSNNLHRGVTDLGWKLDYRKFRIFLEEKFAVKKAYYFIGFIAENAQLYESLKRKGYSLIFKEVVPDQKGEPKGNIDAELVLQAMIDLKEYEKAVIVSGDGDFACLVKYLQEQGKLAQVISPRHDRPKDGKPEQGGASILLKRAAPGKILFLEQHKHRLEYRKE